MRACMLAYTFYENDNRVIRYAEALVEAGYEVDVVALRRPGQSRYERINGVNVYRIQRRTVSEKGRLSYLFKILAFWLNSCWFVSRRQIQRGYDLVHVHSVPDFEIFAAWLPKLTGASLILDIHDIVPEFYASKFQTSEDSLFFKALLLAERWSIAFADHVIIANDLWRQRLIGRSVAAERCTAMINFPDPVKFHPRQAAGGQKSGRFVLLYPGTLNEHQGLDVAIRGLAQVKDRLPDVELHIYGEGPSYRSLVQLAGKLGISDRVLFRPSVPVREIAEVMARADLGVVPKRADSFGNEAFSTKILEFMASGVPVLISRTRIDEYYFDDGLVRFFESGNEEDLASQLVGLRNSEEERGRLRENGLRHATVNNWDVRKHDYLALVDSLRGRATKKSRTGILPVKEKQ